MSLFLFAIIDNSKFMRTVTTIELAPLFLCKLVKAVFRLFRNCVFLKIFSEFLSNSFMKSEKILSIAMQWRSILDPFCKK